MKQTHQTSHIINVIVFCGLLLSGGIASMMLKKETVSVMENRKLASFPVYSEKTLWSGEYFRSIEEYYADNFPFREIWIDISEKFRNRLGFQNSEIKIYNPVNDAEANEKKDTIRNGNLSSQENAKGEIKKQVFVFKNRVFEMFRGSPALGKSYANVINSYSRLLSDDGIQVYNLIIPVALEFEITEKYAHLQSPNRPAIENIYSNEDENIKKVWAIDSLKNHKKEYIYFNTDHHWTSLGAYYAYKAFCEVAKTTPVSLDGVPSKVKPKFLGSLYRLTRDESLEKNPDSVRYYLFPEPGNFYVGDAANGKWYKSKMYGEAVTGPNSYSVFLQGDLPIVKMETEHKNGRKIAVVKESYGNAFAPFLVNNYEKVIVVDQRYYTGDFIAMLKKEGINELLFINNIFAAHTPLHIDKIKELKDFSKKELSLKEPTLKKEPAVKNLPAKILTKADSATVE